jgi:hypothetical protein
MYTEKCQQSQNFIQAAHPVVPDRILAPSQFRDLFYHEAESVSQDYCAYIISFQRSQIIESSARFKGAIVKYTHSVTQL